MDGRQTTKERFHSEIPETLGGFVRCTFGSNADWGISAPRYTVGIYGLYSLSIGGYEAIQAFHVL